MEKWNYIRHYHLIIINKGKENKVNNKEKYKNKGEESKNYDIYNQ